MRKTEPRKRAFPLITLACCIPFFLSLTMCSSALPPAATSEPCGGVGCTSNSDCTVNMPVCAQASSATCLNTSPRECAWKLNISAYCPCLEHDVRLCNYNGSPGVQICTKNSSTSTYWAACIACPSCG